MPRRLDARRPGFDVAFAALLSAKREMQRDVDRTVADIIADVRARGDAALIDYTRRFDRVALTPETLRVPAAEIAAAAGRCAPETLAALRFAATRIEDFHRRQMPADLDYRDAAGVRLGARWRPVAAVGLYVPGGTAAYPSSVLMNALPARVAGVERVVMVVPADAPMARAARMLLRYKVGGLPVMADGRLVGIITETDFLRAFIAAQKATPARKRTGGR